MFLAARSRFEKRPYEAQSADSTDQLVSPMVLR
jgi:hypothetical protein